MFRFLEPVIMHFDSDIQGIKKAVNTAIESTGFIVERKIQNTEALTNYMIIIKIRKQLIPLASSVRK